MNDEKISQDAISEYFLFLGWRVVGVVGFRYVHCWPLWRISAFIIGVHLSFWSFSRGCAGILGDRIAMTMDSKGRMESGRFCDAARSRRTGNDT
jgi:hypothetical protein